MLALVRFSLPPVLASLALAGCACGPGAEVPFERLPACDVSDEVQATTWRINLESLDGGLQRTFEAGGFPPTLRLDSVEPTIVAVEALDQRGAVTGRGRSEPFVFNPDSRESVKVLIRPRGVFSRSCQSLKTPRRGHSTTLLAGNRVLVTGGYDGAGASSATVERLTDIGSATVGALTLNGNSFPRAFHSAVRLASGHVLITGGEIGQTGNTMTLQGVAAVFSDDAAAAGIVKAPVLRARHTSVASPDGSTLLMAGGLFRDQSGTRLADSAERVSLQTFETLGTTALNTVPEAAAAGGPRGVLLAGGLETGVASRNAVIVPFVGPVLTVQLREARRDATAVSVGDDFLVASGMATDGTLLASSEWLRSNGAVEPGPVLAPRRRGCAVETRGNVLLVGGVDQTNAPVASAELVAADGTVTPIPFRGSPRSEQTCTRLEDGTVVVIGGRGPSGTLSDVWYFVP